MRACIAAAAIALAAMPLHAQSPARQAVLPTFQETVPTSPASADDYLRQQERLLGITATPSDARASRRGEIGRRPAAGTSATAPAAGVAAASAAASAVVPAAQPPGAASARLRPGSAPADAVEADALPSGPAPVQLSAFETEYLERRSHIPGGQRCERFVIGADDIAFSRLDERHKAIALAGLLEQAASSQCLAPPR